VNLKKVAVIGSGVSGLVCAYLLRHKFDVCVFEACARAGGHTHTHSITLKDKCYQIDTGFIVYNDWTYPHFIRLLKELGVAGRPTEMSFSVTDRHRNLEYNGHTIATLFAQKRNLLRPWFWFLIKDIIRFNRQAKAFAAGNEKDMSLFDFMSQNKFGDAFRDCYALPMAAAIWSSGVDQIKDFPMRTFANFCSNHGLLNITNRPIWHTVVGGSRSYVDNISAILGDKLHLSTPVEKVRREGGKVYVTNAAGQDRVFDHVIFATHSNQALKLLADKTPDEDLVLGNIPYQNNDILLHTDTSILPKRKAAWASWNYHVAKTSTSLTSVTYNMNILQGIDAPVTFCVSLNCKDQINPELIIKSLSYEHPIFNKVSIDAQSKWHLISGQNGTHYCGAYWGYGFHEDGVNSALRVCAQLGVKWP